MAQRKLSTQVRKLVEEDGRTRYEICKLAKIDQAAMSRFMNEASGLSLPALDRLGQVLEVHLQSRRLHAEPVGELRAERISNGLPTPIGKSG